MATPAHTTREGPPLHASPKRERERRDLPVYYGDVPARTLSDSRTMAPRYTAYVRPSAPPDRSLTELIRRNDDAKLERSLRRCAPPSTLCTLTRIK